MNGYKEGGNKAMTTKVILVTYALGRCGSSATMGLLKTMGISVGSEERLVSAQAMNPKGFFELKSQEQFLRRAFAGFYPGNEILPPQDIVDSIADRMTPDFAHMLAQEFPQNSNIALKAQRGLALPFWHRLRDHYDVRLLLLKRNKDDQVKSISRVWAKLEDPIKRNAGPEVISAHLDTWNGFLTTQLSRVDFPRLPVAFEDLLSDPYEFALRLAAFLDVPPPERNAVDNWIDRSLVNRSEYPALP